VSTCPATAGNPLLAVKGLGRDGGLLRPLRGLTLTVIPLRWTVELVPTGKKVRPVSVLNIERRNYVTEAAGTRLGPYEIVATQTSCSRLINVQRRRPRWSRRSRTGRGGCRASVT